MPKVSVIIPNYNHERYLPARIQSVLDQTYRDFDVLILDDCSTDGSRSVIDRYVGDPRVRVLYNEKNAGSTFRQWAKGLAETTGDYVWIAESDDVADPRFLETLVPMLDRSPNVAMAVCGSHTIDEHDVIDTAPFDFWVERFGVDPKNIEAMKTDLEMKGSAYAANFIWVPWTTLPNASAMLFRRGPLVANVGYGQQMRLCGDTMIYCHILAEYDIARNGAALNLFRQHRKNVRSSTTPFVWIDEGLEIKRFLASRFGAGRWPPLVWRFFVYLSIRGDRAASTDKVPLRRIPSVLRRALRRDFMLFAWTARILALETVAECARQLGFQTRSSRTGVR